MPSVVISWAGRRVIGAPRKRISPAVMGASPEMAMRVEVLPAPLEPMMAVISPSRASRSTPRSAWMWPYSTRRPRTLRTYP